MPLLDCLGLLGNDSSNAVKNTTNDDQRAIIGFYCRGYKNQVVMIDVKSTRVRKVSGLKAFRGDRIWMGNCCNGLILFKTWSATKFVIFNPKSNKIVKTITPPVWFSGYPVGFFYHPLAKEYRTLSVTRTGGQNNYEYHIYQFGSNTWRAALNPSYHWTPSVPRPTHTKQALYWYCGDGIVVFDIIGEKFCVRPSPVCCKEKDLYAPTLVAKNEDSLCCCYVHRAELSIDVWVLEDYGNWSWNRKYVVHLDWCKTNRYLSEAWRAYATRVRVVGIQKDELVFCYKDDVLRSIYSYHLESGVSVRTQLNKTEMKKYIMGDGRKEEKEKWDSPMFYGRFSISSSW